jgi:hypothetical protein
VVLSLKGAEREYGEYGNGRLIHSNAKDSGGLQDITALCVRKLALGIIITTYCTIASGKLPKDSKI